jgi:hypothetical protein
MKQKIDTAVLQARKKTLEQNAIILRVKTDEVSKAKLDAAQAEIEAIDAKLENAALQATATEAAKAAAIKAVEAMEATGDIPLQGQAAVDRKAELVAKFTEDPSMVQLVAGAAMAKQGALAGGRVAPNAASQAINGAASAAMDKIGIEAGASYGYTLSGGYSNFEALAGYNKLVFANSRISCADKGALPRKSALALEAANWYNTHLRPNLEKWERIPLMEINKMTASAVRGAPLQAADYTDPNNNLGILSGTLVLQRTLPVFKYKYPELLAMWTDFSDNPGVYNQTEETRIVVQPAVQTYNATLGADNRPQGWSTISAGQTTNVTISLNNYVSVPINFGNNIIAATTRRLFDEQAVLAIAGIAGYFTTLVTNLLTSGNYNYYAAVNGTLVPVAYTTYKMSQNNFGMGDLDNLDSIFTSSKVPEDDRGILLNPGYYAKLRGDPRLEFYYAASAKSIGAPGDFLAEAKLPKLSGFAPYKAGYLPASTPATTPTTNYVTGFAFQKSAILLKSRLPTDYTTALGPTNVPGSITTVTDPDTGISLMLVQYVNLEQGWAEWRPEVMLGVAVGDYRAGLVLTSQ